MSLYNAIMGTNPLSGLFLGMLGIDISDVPRFRDTWFNPETESIVIYTRTGGGNREAYEAENDHLTTFPGFKFDRDDDFDCTYAEFHYAVPEEFGKYINALKKLSDGEDRGGDGFRQVIDNMGKAYTADPRVQRALDVGEQILGQISKVLKEDSTP